MLQSRKSFAWKSKLRRMKILWASPLTTRWLATWGTRECCRLPGPSAGDRCRRRRALDGGRRCSPQRTPRRAPSPHFRTLCCRVPTRQRSICQFKFSSLRKSLPLRLIFRDIYLGGQACVLHCTTVDSGREAELQSDSSTSAPVKRFLHVGTAIL